MAGGNLNFWGTEPRGNEHVGEVRKIVRTVGAEIPQTRIPILGLGIRNYVGPPVFTAYPWGDADSSPSVSSHDEMLFHTDFFSDTEDEVLGSDDADYDYAQELDYALGCVTIDPATDQIASLGSMYDGDAVNRGFSITTRPVYNSSAVIEAYARTQAGLL